MILELEKKTWRNVKMSIELVGFENLPNAFIKQIILTDNTEGSFNISLDIITKDVKDSNGDFLWSKDSILSKFLKLGVLFVDNKQVIQNISSGSILPSDISLFNYRQSRSLSFSKAVHGEIIEYQSSFSYTNNKNNITDLAVFVYCFIDIKQLSQAYNLKLHVDDIRYSGPIKSEKIIENSKILSQTNVFERPNGSLWSGPVHNHNGQYMIGAYHSDSPHDKLRLRKISNLKIKDKRKQKNIKPDKTSKIPIEISELTVSYDENTDVNGIFMINVKSLLINNTKYGNFLRKTSDVVMREILANFKFSLFMIERHRVTTTISTNTFGSPRDKVVSVFSKKNIVKSYDTFSGLKNNTRLEKKSTFDISLADLPSASGLKVLQKDQIYKEDISTYKKISEIKEISMDYGKNLRYFDFTDMELGPTTPGKYQYKLSIHFQDPVYSFLEATVVNMKRSLSEAKRYLGYISRKINYNYESNTTKFSNYTLYDLNSLTQEYLKHYSYIYNYDDSIQENMSLKIFSMLNPAGATIDSVRKFVDMYSKLLKELMSFLDFNDQKQYDVSIKKSIESKIRTNRIVYEKKFNNIIEPSLNYKRLRYLENQDQKGIKIFTKRQVLSRVQREIDKHFNSQPNFSTKENNFLSVNVKTALNNIRNNSTKFLSPVALEVDNQKIDLRRNENINFNTFHEALNRTRLIQKDNILKIKKPSIETQDQPERFIASREIIGENHEFVSYDNIKGSYNEFNEDSKVQSVIVTAYKDMSNKKIDDFDLTKNKTKFTSDEYLGLPLQIKAILGRKLEATNGEFLENGKDMLASPETKDFIDVNNLNVARIKFLSEYEKDKNGEVMLDKPIYKEMDLANFSSIEKPVLCNLSVYSNNKFNIQDNLKANIVNSAFIISDQQVNTSFGSNDDTSISFLDASSISYEYTSTNIIVQTNNNTYMNNQAASTSPQSSATDSSSTINTSTDAISISNRTRNIGGGY